MRLPETDVPSESRTFSKETSFQFSGHPRKYSTFPFTSWTSSYITAVVAAHCPSICMMSLPQHIVVKPPCTALWCEPCPSSQ